MKTHRVLLIYAGWLGDLVWIVPTLHALKRMFESVSLVVSEVQAPLAEIMTNGLIDEVHVDHPSHRLSTARAVRRRARETGVDTCIDLKGRWKTGIYMPWTRNVRIFIPHRNDAREALPARGLHPRAIAMPMRPEGHMVDAYLADLAALQAPRTPISFALPFREETLASAEQLIEREGLRTGRSVALHPGSAQFSKIWPAENFRRLADILRHDLNCKVVVMGAHEFAPNDNYDQTTARRFFRDGSVTNLVDETSLAVDAYLLSSGVFSVSVGNDSFANHMAGSAHETEPGAPGAARAPDGRWFKANRTVSLFGPTNPIFCRPYDPTDTFNTVLLPESYPPECVYDREAHTCPHYGDRYCSDRAHCMSYLSVERVAGAVETQLREQGS